MWKIVFIISIKNYINSIYMHVSIEEWKQCIILVCIFVLSFEDIGVGIYQIQTSLPLIFSLSTKLFTENFSKGCNKTASGYPSDISPINQNTP